MTLRSLDRENDNEFLKIDKSTKRNIKDNCHLIVLEVLLDHYSTTRFSRIILEISQSGESQSKYERGATILLKSQE